MKIEGKRHWLHVASNEKYTCYFAHPKRGAEAIDAMGILPKFKGVAVHDGWKPYNVYECDHALCYSCGAHRSAVNYTLNSYKRKRKISHTYFLIS